MGGPCVFVSAGELSGDVVGARLVAEILRRDPSTYVFGTGGPRMTAAGADIGRHTHHIGVVGITEGFKTLPSVVATCRDIRRRLAEVQPDVAVLIGNDVFNVMLARWLRRRGVPTVSYFPPQVWIWRSLAGPIARSFDAIVASFPEEHAVYAATRAPSVVSFAGHYLAGDLRPVAAADRHAARRQLRLPVDTTVIGLLPGSRRDEIRALTPVLLDAASLLLARDPALTFAVAVADAPGADAVGKAVAAHPIARSARLCTDGHAVMRSADLVLVASGTASLEAALFGVPMIIVYKVSAITHLVVRAAIRFGLIESYTVGLPNLVLGRAAVPEALQNRARAPIVADEAWALLSQPARVDEMRRSLAAVADRLRGRQPIADVANAVLALAAEGRHV